MKGIAATSAMEVAARILKEEPPSIFSDDDLEMMRDDAQGIIDRATGLLTARTGARKRAQIANEEKADADRLLREVGG